MKAKFMKMLENKTAKIGIIGLGYVGLPLLVAFSEAGFDVTGYDKSLKKVATIEKGESDIIDIPSERLLPLIASGKVEISSDKDCLKNLDILLICVPTPLTKSYEPDTSYIKDAMEDIISTWSKEKCIILESTTYPGTSREMIHQILKNLRYELDKDYMVAYSPERVDPGNKTYHVENTPKVVGGMSADSTVVSTAVYDTVVNQVVAVGSPEVAEMSKLLENTFRSINIAFINEMALLCENMGIDIWETIEASSTKPFGFMKFLPGPGVGGHCIPLDPLYLSWKAKEYNFFNRFISLSHEINQTMPDHIATKAMETLNLHCKSIKNASILLLGMAYKENIDDLRESPSLKIYENLKKLGANVEFCDPLASDFVDAKGITRSSVPLDYEAFSQYDLIILVTNHVCFDLDRVADKSKLILDTKNALSNKYPDKTVRIGTKTVLQQAHKEEW